MLSKLIPSAGKAISEVTNKDILKFSKQALSDKALAIQRAATDVCGSLSVSLLILRLILCIGPDSNVSYNNGTIT